MSQKIVIVTGASRGLGHAIVQALLKQDHKVFAVARSETELKQLKDQNGSSVDYMAGDLGDFSVGLCFEPERYEQDSHQITGCPEGH